ncbi:hypothetical protein [Fibrobacter sp.]
MIGSQAKIGSARAMVKGKRWLDLKTGLFYAKLALNMNQMPNFAQKSHVDLRVFKSVWIKIRVAETPKERVVRVARG